MTFQGAKMGWQSTGRSPITPSGRTPVTPRAQLRSKSVPNKRKPEAKRPRRWVRRGLLGLVLLLVVGSAAWWVRDGGVQRVQDTITATILEFLGHQGFVVRDVLVEGQGRTTQEDILKALDIQVGASIFEPDLNAMRERLQELPWVERAVLQRRLPSTLVVQLTERAMLARWQNHGSLKVIDRSGAPIISIPVGAEPYQHLLLVIGSDAASEAPELINMLKKFPDLEPHVVVAQRVGERRWNLTVENAGVKVRVLLPENKPTEALQLLQKLQQAGRLLERDIAEVDLRLPKNPIVHMTAEGLQKLRNETKS